MRTCILTRHANARFPHLRGATAAAATAAVVLASCLVLGGGQSILGGSCGAAGQACALHGRQQGVCLLRDTQQWAWHRRMLDYVQLSEGPTAIASPAAGKRAEWPKLIQQTAMLELHSTADDRHTRQDTPPPSSCGCRGRTCQCCGGQGPSCLAVWGAVHRQGLWDCHGSNTALVQAGIGVLRKETETGRAIRRQQPVGPTCGAVRALRGASWGRTHCRKLQRLLEAPCA